MQTERQKSVVKFFPLLVRPIPAKPLVFSTSDLYVLPADHYNQQLGWVCKQEWKLEKKTSIPLKLRLGSKEQVDYLEGKFSNLPFQ